MGKIVHVCATLEGSTKRDVSEVKRTTGDQAPNEAFNGGSNGAVMVQHNLKSPGFTGWSREGVNPSVIHEPRKQETPHSIRAAEQSYNRISGRRGNRSRRRESRTCTVLAAAASRTESSMSIAKPLTIKRRAARLKRICHIREGCDLAGFTGAWVKVDAWREAKKGADPHEEA
jgi:hypothetical protein